MGNSSWQEEDSTSTRFLFVDSRSEQVDNKTLEPSSTMEARRSHKKAKTNNRIADELHFYSVGHNKAEVGNRIAVDVVGHDSIDLPPPCRNRPFDTADLQLRSLPTTIDNTPPKPTLGLGPRSKTSSGQPRRLPNLSTSARPNVPGHRLDTTLSYTPDDPCSPTSYNCPANRSFLCSRNGTSRSYGVRNSCRPSRDSAKRRNRFIEEKRRFSRFSRLWKVLGVFELQLNVFLWFFWFMGFTHATGWRIRGTNGTTGRLWTFEIVPFAGFLFVHGTDETF